MQPQIIIAFGAIAAQAITGKALSVEGNRGKLFPLPHGGQALVTDHPAFILRISDQATRLQQYKKLVVDLKLAANMVTLAAS